jgi:hypothetical protein
MIRSSIAVLAVCLFAATTTMGQDKEGGATKQDKNVKPAAHETKVAPWFDLDHCAVCKCMASQKGLMESIKWEWHMLDNGAMSVSVVPEGQKEAMKKCHDEMHAVIDKVKKGEKMELCACCQSYGALEQAGAKFTEIETAAGTISLITSDRPDVVKKIKEHAQKTMDEFKATMAGTKKPAK